MTGNVEKLEIKDPTGLHKNINDLFEEIRNDNVESISIVYSRRDGSTRTFWSGWNRIQLIGIIEQLKFDLLYTAIGRATMFSSEDEE